MKEQLTAAEQKVFSDFVQNIDWSNPMDANKRALATTIVESIGKDVYSQEIISLIATTRRFGPGEDIQFKTTKGLVAYVVEPGAYAPRSQVTNTVITLPKKSLTVATELHIDQLRTGRYGTIADLKKDAAEQFLGAQNAMAWEVAWRAVTSSTTDSNYASVSSSASAATKKSALDTAISYLYDYTPGGAKAIIGRFSALSFLQDLDYQTLPDSMREDLYKRDGFLGVYRGVPVINLKSFKDPYGNQKISASYILVLGTDVMKYGIQEPGLEVYEQTKGTTTRTWEMALWMTVGCAVINSNHIYNISLS